MILPKTRDNYLKCILPCFSMEHRVTCPMFFYQVLWKFYLYGDCVNFGKKRVEFILIVYDKNMNNQDEGNIVALCTRWCEVSSNLTICGGMVYTGGCCTRCTGKTGCCTIRDSQVVRAERLLDSMRSATTISWGVWAVGCCILAAEYFGWCNASFSSSDGVMKVVDSPPPR